MDVEECGKWAGRALKSAECEWAKEKPLRSQPHAEGYWNIGLFTAILPQADAAIGKGLNLVLGSGPSHCELKPLAWLDALSTNRTVYLKA